ncbi:C4-dicarboxylate ABC transporter substrate-binding protein, partial [Rhodovulum sulfidophilum]|nr:C4-dicarboxylate ABC transporter substrate-binding protein [Rhodovulum sulfidophilum]
RSNIIVSNGEYLAKFEEAGVEILTLDPEDVVEARGRAIEYWSEAATDDLSRRMMESQIALMKELRLL